MVATLLVSEQARTKTLPHSMPLFPSSPSSSAPQGLKLGYPTGCQEDEVEGIRADGAVLPSFVSTLLASLFTGCISSAVVFSAGQESAEAALLGLCSSSGFGISWLPS